MADVASGIAATAVLRIGLGITADAETVDLAGWAGHRLGGRREAKSGQESAGQAQTQTAQSLTAGKTAGQVPGQRVEVEAIRGLIRLAVPSPPHHFAPYIRSIDHHWLLLCASISTARMSANSSLTRKSR
jgi:hypothetical protein